MTMTTLAQPPQPADHPLLQHRAIWLLTGSSPAWLADARRFAAEPQGPLMRWRAAENLLQVVDRDSLDQVLLALLDLAPVDFTLVCEPGTLHDTTKALIGAVTNLLDPPPAHALRVSEQQAPFTALLPRLQQPEAMLADAWLGHMAQPQTAGHGTPETDAEGWCALAAVGGQLAAPVPPALQARVQAAAQALADWSAQFSAQFAPGELAQVFVGEPADDADHDTPNRLQPPPLLQPFKPRQTEDDWVVLRPGPVPSVAGHAAAAAAAAASGTAGAAGPWQAEGSFPGPVHGAQATEAGRYALVLTGEELNATVSLHLAALPRAPEPGQTLALALRAADGLALRLRGHAGKRPADGTWAIQLQRLLSAADAARLRAQPAGSVQAELWWAPGG